MLGKLCEMGFLQLKGLTGKGVWMTN